VQHELSPDVLAAIVVQMNGEGPSLSAGIRVAPVITGKLQLPSARWPVETLLGEFVKHLSPIQPAWCAGSRVRGNPAWEHIVAGTDGEQNRHCRHQPAGERRHLVTALRCLGESILPEPTRCVKARSEPAPSAPPQNRGKAPPRRVYSNGAT
jgi:hypothetical protein